MVRKLLFGILPLLMNTSQLAIILVPQPVVLLPLLAFAAWTFWVDRSYIYRESLGMDSRSISELRLRLMAINWFSVWCALIVTAGEWPRLIPVRRLPREFSFTDATRSLVGCLFFADNVVVK